MKTFSTKVDLRSRKEMIDFLANHFRYDTMNSWNASTSYAANVKVYNLGLSSEQSDKLWEMICTDDFYDEIDWLLEDFAINHNYAWQVGFNGRSGGYLVLYQGGRRELEYKSRCTKCGQLNYQPAMEDNCRCGVCGQDTRVNLTHPIMQSFTYSGRGTDMYEDFEDWDMYSIKQRVKLIQEFDKLCDDILSYVKELIDNVEVEEETYYVPQKRKVLVTA